jgi:hypothetical protein
MTATLVARCLDQRCDWTLSTAELVTVKDPADSVFIAAQMHYHYTEHDLQIVRES